MGNPPTGGLEASVTHYAYVVDDIDAAAKQWSTAFGAGRFFLFEDVGRAGLGLERAGTEVLRREVPHKN